MSGAERPPSSAVRHRLFALGLLCVTLAGTVGSPPGCWPALLSGYTGREPLHMYLMVGIYVPFGSTDVTLRLASTLIGIASVPARYLPVGAIGTTPRRKHLCPDERLAVESITISRRQACVRTG